MKKLNCFCHFCYFHTSRLKHRIHVCNVYVMNSNLRALFFSNIQGCQSSDPDDFCLAGLNNFSFLFFYYLWLLVSPTWWKIWSRANGKIYVPGCPQPHYQRWSYGTLVSTCHLAFAATLCSLPRALHASLWFWSVLCPQVSWLEVHHK